MFNYELTKEEELESVEYFKELFKYIISKSKDKIKLIVEYDTNVNNFTLMRLYLDYQKPFKLKYYFNKDICIKQYSIYINIPFRDFLYKYDVDINDIDYSYMLSSINSNIKEYLDSINIKKIEVEKYIEAKERLINNLGIPIEFE